MVIKLENETGLQKQAKLGFSWTMLFFGFLVPAFRGDLKWAIITFLVSLATLGIAWLVLPFIYNKKYIEGLLEKSYRPANAKSKEALQRRGIIKEGSSTEDSGYIDDFH